MMRNKKNYLELQTKAMPIWYFLCEAEALVLAATKLNSTLVQIPFLSLIFDSWLVNSKFQFGKKCVSYKLIIFKTNDNFFRFSSIKAHSNHFMFCEEVIKIVERICVNTFILSPTNESRCFISGFRSANWMKVTSGLDTSPSQINYLPEPVLNFISIG